MPRGQEKEPKQRQPEHQDPNAGRNRNPQDQEGGPGDQTQAYHSDQQRQEGAEQE